MVIFIFIVSLLLLSQFVNGFVNNIHSQPLNELRAHSRDFENDIISEGQTRRNFLLGSSLATSIVIFPSIAFSEDSLSVNFDCLESLPPVRKDNVRLYLCRHGQTENNRLRKVQGARVDAPINYNGNVQAQNLGKSLARAKPCPSIFFCSDLLRAKMTAEVASSEIDSSIQPKQLDLLREVDFGPVADGQPVALAKAGMQATYAAWAFGNIDYRPSGGGESGREVSFECVGFAYTILNPIMSNFFCQVLNRATDSLQLLVKEAKASDGTLAAVTHSTFLRILIALILDEPLAESASRKLDNCGVTVVDIPKNFSVKGLGTNPRLLGGSLSQVPKDFELLVPICNVIRINESRHLPQIPAGELLTQK